MSGEELALISCKVPSQTSKSGFLNLTRNRLPRWSCARLMHKASLALCLCTCRWHSAKHHRIIATFFLFPTSATSATQQPGFESCKTDFHSALRGAKPPTSSIAGAFPPTMLSAARSLHAFTSGSNESLHFGLDTWQNDAWTLGTWTRLLD